MKVNVGLGELIHECLLLLSILCLFYKPKDIYLAVLVLDELQNNT
jgi:hypothetical protein